MSNNNDETWQYMRPVGGLSGFWVHPAVQMSEAWFADRYGRLNGQGHQKVLNASTRDEVVATALGDNIIHVDPAHSYGIDMEPRARCSYINQHVLPSGSYWETGLCIPDPADPVFGWLPVHLRRLLVHVGASPDLCMIQRGKFCIAEFKCPEKQVIYPDVLATGRARTSHYHQMQSNCGILGASACDYYVWTPTKQHRLTVSFNKELFNRTLANVLSVIEKHIVPEVDYSKMTMPAQLYM